MIPPVKLRQACSRPRAGEGDHLAEHQLEGDPLRAGEEAEHQEEEQGGGQQRRAGEEPAGDGHAQDLHPHQGAHQDRGRQHALAVLDLRGADDRRDHLADLLQRKAKPDDGVGAGQHAQARRQDAQAVRGQQVQIGRHEGRGVDQAKAGHAQHAVQVVGGVVAPQVGPDEPLVLGLRLRLLGVGCRGLPRRRVRPPRSRSGWRSRLGARCHPTAAGLLEAARLLSGPNKPLRTRCPAAGRSLKSQAYLGRDASCRIRKPKRRTSPP